MNRNYLDRSDVSAKLNELKSGTRININEKMSIDSVYKFDDSFFSVSHNILM